MSTKTIARKLLIKPGLRLWLSPETEPGLLEPLPDNVDQVADLADADVAIVSVSTAAEATSILAALAPDLGKPQVLWVFYPKGNVTDINRDSLWSLLAGYGLRPITQVAVDDIWSALRFRPLRADEKPFVPDTGASAAT